MEEGQGNILLESALLAHSLCERASKALCVTRNYVAHAAELGNSVSSSPIFFTKTPNCFTPMTPDFAIPVDYGLCHYELEIVLVMAKAVPRPLLPSTPLASLVSAVALGLDLTLREEQTRLKDQALPWTVAKSFDGAAPISNAIAFEEIGEQGFSQLCFDFWVNGELKQRGCANDMVFDIRRLLEDISGYITLLPGDLVFTGTPAGVGPIRPGDHARAILYRQNAPMAPLLLAECDVLAWSGRIKPDL